MAPLTNPYQRGFHQLIGAVRVPSLQAAAFPALTPPPPPLTPTPAPHQCVGCVVKVSSKQASGPPPLPPLSAAPSLPFAPPPLPQLTSASVWSKCRPNRRLRSVSLLPSIFMATDCPARAVSTDLWLSSMDAMRPRSMPSLVGTQIGVPT